MSAHPRICPLLALPLTRGRRSASLHRQLGEALDMADRDRQGGGILGGVLLMLGLVLLGVVLAADIGGTPWLEALALQLGLATAPLLEAFGVALALTGGWLIVRARRG